MINRSVIWCVWFFVLCPAAVMADVPVKMVYTSAGLRSPFKRQFSEEAVLVNTRVRAKDKLRSKEDKMSPPPQIIVEGIVSGRKTEHQPQGYAIIGGKVFGLGDEVSGALITGITKEGVEVSFDTQKLFYPAPSKALAVSRERKDAE